jgi:hypothetical protein
VYGCQFSVIRTLTALHFAECRTGSDLRENHVAGAGAGAADPGQYSAFEEGIESLPNDWLSGEAPLSWFAAAAAAAEAQRRAGRRESPVDVSPAVYRVPLPRRDLSDAHLIQLRCLHFISNEGLDKRRAAGLSMLGLSKINLCKLRVSADFSKLSDAAVDRMIAHCAKTFGCTETRWPMASIRKHARAVCVGDPLLRAYPPVLAHISIPAGRPLRIEGAVSKNVPFPRLPLWSALFVGCTQRWIAFEGRRRISCFTPAMCLVQSAVLASFRARRLKHTHCVESVRVVAWHSGVFPSQQPVCQLRNRIPTVASDSEENL